MTGTAGVFRGRPERFGCFRVHPVARAAVLAIRRAWRSSDVGCAEGFATRAHVRLVLGLALACAVGIASAGGRAAAGHDGHAPVAADRGSRQNADALAQWLQGTQLTPGEIGLIAVPLDGGGAPLVTHRAVQPLNPASAMKILTTLAALAMLGPEHRWRTAAHLRGRLDGDVLNGDLVLRGGGDPKLVVEDLTAFVARMRAAGLREIRGNLVVDDALFDVGGDSVERFDDDPSQPYNVRPHPLLMNFKSSRLVLEPAGAQVALRFDPPLDGVAIDADVRPLAGPCRGDAAELRVRDLPAGTASGVKVRGAWAPACGEQGVFVSVLSHRAFIEALFRAVWRAAGGHWSGQARFEPGAARALAPWLQWESPRTLADVVRDINKFSNNVMARQVFLQLASPAGDGPATIADARDAVRHWLRGNGLESSGLVLDNGSGLSRDERISAAGLTQLLRFAAGGPHADLLRESLPLAGVDGTMKRRLAGEPLVGRAWIKTGSLADTRAIAGYVDAVSGRRYAVALLINSPRIDRARLLQDRFLRWVYDRG